jgi:DNA-binding NtrC family response regulator/two-component sensor histidine kinase
MSIKILIVEDLFIEANDLRLILEKAGHTVCGVAKSVDQAMGLLKRDRPEMVLLDIFLKGHLTGIHLAQYLSAQNIPFIYLSANSNPSTLEAAKSTKPYGFLVKPYREKDILVALDIADYRHRQMVDMMAKQEKWLSNLLLNIINEMTTQEQKLLLLVKAFKNFIPFDHVYIDTDANREELAPFYGFERIGFDEYSPIALPEFGKKTRLSSADMNAFRKTILNKKDIQLKAGDDFTAVCLKCRFAERLSVVFAIQSCLCVPILIEKGRSFSINFFSLQNDAFNMEQAELLRPLRTLLATVIENVGRQAYPLTAILPDNDAFTNFEQQAAIQGIVGKSPKLLHVFDLILQVAAVESTVLISGETGVGKEGLASAIHQLSPRKKKPLVKINCAAIPENLIESELFGHERGAFTSAVDKRIGKFEQAQGGTIFLDEIGELPWSAQSKLLRVLQEKEIERVGGHSTIRIDVRIIAATNRNLHKEVSEGRFRMDLYYRIHVFPIHVPPLRERKEDIPLLVRHFLQIYAGMSGDKAKTVTPEVMQQLTAHSWPGNIRELQHVIERHVISSRGPVISLLDLPARMFPDPDRQFPDPAARDTYSRSDPSRSDPSRTDPGHDTDKEEILEALKRCNGRVSGKNGAAEMLGVNPNTLTSRMKKLGINWKYNLFTCLLILSLLPVSGQRVSRIQADSLMRLVRQNGKDLPALTAMLELAHFYILKNGEEKVDLDSAAALIEKAKQLNQPLRSREAEGYIDLHEAYLYDERGQREKGRQMTERSVSLLRSGANPDFLGKACLNLSGYYRFLVESEAMIRIDLVKEALTCFEKSGNIERQAISLEMLTELHTPQDISLGIQYGNRAIRLYKSIPHANMIGIFIKMATIYRAGRDMPSALHFCILARQNAAAIGVFPLPCSVDNMAGLICFDLQEPDSAAYYLSQSLAEAKMARDTSNVHLVGLNLAHAYIVLHHPSSAIQLLDDNQRNWSVPRDVHHKARYLSIYLDAYRASGEFAKAEPYCVKVLRAAGAPDISSPFALFLYAAAMHFYLDSRQYEKGRAIQPKLKAALLNSPVNSNLAPGYEFLFRLDTAQHHYPSAIANLLQRDIIKDTSFTETKNQQIQQLRIEYETAQKENNIAMLQKEKQLQGRALDQSIQNRNYSIAGSALLLLLLGTGFSRYRLKQRKNRQLEARQKEITEKNSQLEVTQKEITGKNVQLQRLLNENEWLFREIHHRVKNNLQIVMSLLNSQSLYLKDKQAANAVLESRNRVQAMSLIHQKLYKTNNVSTINMPEYINDLVDYLKASMHATFPVHFDLEIASVNLDVVQAVPVGLILNEVITNSFKYAFPNTPSAVITVRIMRSVGLGERLEERLTLYIADNGCGINPRHTAGTGNSFGMLLINGLVEDLDGTLLIESGKGTAYNISFACVQPGEKNTEPLFDFISAHPV